MCLLLCISMLCMGAAAAGEPTLVVSSQETIPAVGHTFYVAVSIQNNPGVNAVQFTLKFDNAVVDCISADIGKVLSGSLAASNPDAADGAIIAAANSETMTGDGNLGVFAFKVVSQGKPNFSLSDIVLSDGNGKDIAYKTDAAVATDTTKPETGSSGTGVTGDDTGATKPTAKAQFSDVPSSHWAYNSINAAAEAGLVAGYPDGSFHPGEYVSRAQFVTVLWSNSSKPLSTASVPFADVSSSAYYAKAVAWACEKGFVSGYKNSDGTYSFHPDQTITREQAMAILFKYSGGVSGMELTLTAIYDSQFTDSSKISPYAKNAMYWAVYKGYISGTTSTTLDPQGLATRAQTAQIIVNYNNSNK